MKIEKKLYAVVDVETTGGKPSQTKITEIAIYITDGERILDEYSTLINPNRPIDWYVIKLTGITNDMVAKEEPFSIKAEKIYSLLEDKIFVAHNVDFDYHIVRREFMEIGIPFDAKRLCTVKSSRKVFPGYSSYSLGVITKHLGIELPNAHRASDDARATAELLHKVLKNSDEQFIHSEIKAQNHLVEIPNTWRVHEDKTIHSGAGIIYFHNEENEILYIESSSNIQKSLFTLINPNKKHDQLEIKLIENTRFITLDYIHLEFKAEIKALNDIQAHKPKYNKVMKPHSNMFIIHLKKDEHEMLYLNIVRSGNYSSENRGPVIYTSSFKNAEKIKQKIIYSQDLSHLPSLKKQILKSEEAIKSVQTQHYNDALWSKIVKEYICPIEEGFYVLQLKLDNEVEVIYVKDYYIHSWGQALLINNQILEYRSEFKFDSNQKLTRKFLNLVPKISYRIVRNEASIEA